MGASQYDRLPSSEADLAVEEKRGVECTQTGPVSKESRHRRDSRKMTSRRVVLALAMCLLVTFGMASAVVPRKVLNWKHCHREHGGEDVQVQESDDSAFMSMLREASRESLHDLLHKYLPDRFQHGVWPSEQKAVEAVHEEDAALAATIVQLAKRDGGNSTSSATNSGDASSSTPPPQTSTTTQTTEPPSSTASTSVPASTSSPVHTSSTSTVPASTSRTTNTSSRTSSSGTSTGQATASLTPTPSPSQSTTVASSGTHSRSNPSSGGSSTSTSTTLKSSTTTSATSSETVTSTFTSTNSDGGVVVVTQTTVVGAPAESGPTSSQPTGSLQTNAALPAKGRAAGLELVIGAVIGGVLLA